MRKIYKIISVILFISIIILGGVMLNSKLIDSDNSREKYSIDQKVRYTDGVMELTTTMRYHSNYIGESIYTNTIEVEEGHITTDKEEEKSKANSFKQIHKSLNH